MEMPDFYGRLHRHVDYRDNPFSVSQVIQEDAIGDMSYGLGRQLFGHFDASSQ